MYARIAMVVALLVGPLSAWGQPLADKVPSDALIYVGWRGSESMGADFEKSRLKAVLDESNIPAVFNEMFPRLVARVGMEEQEAAMAMQIVAAIGGPMWRHPTAMYVGPMNWEGERGPQPRIALMCQAGNEAAALKDQIAQLLQMAGRAPVPVSVFQQGDLVVLQVGFAREADAVAAGNAQALVNSESFKAAMAKVQREPVFIAYGDLDALMAQVDQGVNMAGDPQAADAWPKAKAALGLSGLKRFIWTSGFDGAEWGSRCFISAPAPRTGLLAMLDAEPLSDDILRTIPQTATIAGAGKLDLSGLVAAVRDLAGKFDPEGAANVDQALGVARMTVGFDVQTDLFEGLGPEWAVYTDPQSSGKGLFGMTLVNKLRKPAEVEQALGKLEAFANNMIAGQMQRQKMTIEFKEQKVGDLNIHYLAVPLVAPAWAVKDGYLYAGLYPQVVVSAADASARKQSILENAQFTALRKRLGGEKASGFSFVNLPETAGDGYQTLMMLGQLGTGAAEMFGVKAPMMLLPPLGKLRPHLTPMASFSWSDADGWHMRNIMPFPGAGVLSMEAGAGPMVLMGWFGTEVSPDMARARANANRAKSAANLRSVGMAMMMYANDNKDAFPPDLGVLMTSADLTPEVFISPRGRTSIPAHIRTAKPADQAAWVKSNSDYIYLGAGKLAGKVGADTVVAYEKPHIGDGQGANVLYGDGHVDWQYQWNLNEIIKGANARPAP